MRSKDFVSVFLLQQLLVTASRSGKEKEMNRKNMKKLLFAAIAVVIVAKIARDIMKARKQKENIPSDTFDDFYEEELNWWDKDLEEGEE
jgi:F0F1-type ATP synthase membrane subunit a